MTDLTPEEFRLAFRERLEQSSIQDVTTLTEGVDKRYKRIMQEEYVRFRKEHGLYKPGFWERVAGWFKTKEV